MKRALLLAALLSPLAARAQPTVALRVAYAGALGSAAQQMPVADSMGAQVPIQGDALWRFGAPSAGLYVSWGPAQAAAGSCDDGATCSASVLRLGVQGQWAFAPVGSWRLLPWAGLGAGWERATSSRSRLGTETRSTYSGPEASVQGGLDWPLGSRFALGPFMEVAVGRYRTLAVETPFESASGDIVDKAFHTEVYVGVRCRLDFHPYR